jgi:iron(II)-dependent oxidoreductase
MTVPLVTLRVDFSHEDKAAKGLRSLKTPAAAPEPAVYFTADEMADMTPHLLLTGGRGAGKTVFARARAARTGAELAEIAGPALPEITNGDRPLIVDGIDRLDPAGTAALTERLAQMPARPVLLLGETMWLRDRPLPAGFVAHALLDLQADDRAEALGAGAISHPWALAKETGNPALFALAIGEEGLTGAPSIEALMDAYCATRPGADAAGFAGLAGGRSANRRVDDLLAARHLAGQTPATAAALFRADPDRWLPVLENTLRRRSEWVPTLLDSMASGRDDTSLRGALLLAAVAGDARPVRTALQRQLLETVEAGRLTAVERDMAARRLALWGDPRDLAALCTIPGGRFTMGSATHPNSAPVHQVVVEGVRIGRYPVTNAAYAAFAGATGRHWGSPEANVPERVNAPATDLTWHDARAYCRWLTDKWRDAGQIGPDELVRLPTEPEWERAARGDQGDPGDDTMVYPWGATWKVDAANSEEAGFNMPCAVGLFPAGASLYGCMDMAGQVWEWTTTSWGDDMTTPSLRYPYADDGREDPGAGPAIRRVLRGGCFSSNRSKANCTYRGSLEPDGFWRGNGFRIIVDRCEDL